MSYLVPQTLDAPFPPGVSSQESNPLTDTLMVLSSQISSKVELALSDLYTLINSHPFFVLFEARLACNSQTDHTVARSVLPVFQDDFIELFASLQAEILRDLEPYLEQLSHETAVCWKGENSGILKKFKQIELENTTTKTTIVELEAEKKDNTLNYEAELKKLQNEILELREMLFQQKRIGMPIYKPDYEGEYAQQKEKSDVFSKKQHDDIIAEVLLKNQKQIDKLEKDYKAQMQEVLKQMADERNESQLLKQQITDLREQLDESKLRGESDAQKTSQEYELLFIELEQAIQEANAKTESESDKYEEVIAAKDAKILELEEMIRQQRLEIDRLNAQLSSSKQSLSAVSSARGQPDPTTKLLTELSELRDMCKRLQESLDETLRGKEYVEEAYQILKDQLNQAQMDEEERERLADADKSMKAGKMVDQKDAFGAEMEELQELLKTSRDAYVDLRKTSNTLFSSLFHLENGGLTRMLRVKDPRFSPYEQLKADSKRENLSLDSLKDLAGSLQLVKDWCAEFCPEAPVQDDKQFFDILEINKRSNGGLNMSRTTAKTSVRGTTERMASDAHYETVNSVVLHPSLTEDERISNGQTNDIGINTSICASLEDGVHQNVMVDKSVMYECSSCAASRSNSRAGSTYQRDNSLVENASACLTGSRPQSAAFENMQAALEFGYRESEGLLERPASSMSCSACGKSAPISRIEIGAAGNIISAVNINHQCGECNARSENAQITCPACHKTSRATEIGIFAEDSDGSVEYFEDGDFAAATKPDLKVNELNQASARKRPESGVARVNSDSHIQRPETAGGCEDARHESASIPGGPESNSLFYTCPHCNARTGLGSINLISGFPQFIYGSQTVQPERLRGHSAPANYQQGTDYLFQPARAGAYSASRHTQFETEGTVFDRLLYRARELEDKFRRKRDLILQERKRTTERVLRSLSLFIENFPSTESGVYSTQTARCQGSQSGMKTSQTVRFSTAQVSMRFSSPVKAFIRPQSSKVEEVSNVSRKMFRSRPMSGGAARSEGREESVLELLAASGVLKK